jgi:eukaryotic-like serine/threonine-protein kinase
MTQPDTPGPEQLASLPAALALEVDALCDDFERRWRHSRGARPDPEVFAARTAPTARSVLRACLLELERELRNGPTTPDIPGLTVEEEIGRGGMGVVYRARRHPARPGDLGQPVALKLIPGAERVRWSRWLADLADLRHPNLVPLEGFGTHDGLHYVVMPLVLGGDLRERFAELALAPSAGPGALEKVVRLMEKVVRAVAFLHRRGILHRDLKPSNILLAAPDGWEPLVCDFGLAGRLDEDAPGSQGVGTPSYMAPEQMAGGAGTSAPGGRVAGDLWSLGAILYELLTGRPPFVSPAGGLNTAAKLADPHPADPHVLNPAAAPTLERVCRRCLARNPADRYPTADELADDLLCYRNERPLVDSGRKA